MLKKKSSQPQHLATGAEEVILKDALTRSAVKVQQNWTKQDGKITISFQRKKKVRTGIIIFVEFQSQQSSNCFLRHDLAAADQDSQ